MTRRSGSYIEYEIEDGARITANEVFENRIVAMGIGGMATTEKLQENAAINEKRMQRCMVGLGGPKIRSFDNVKEYFLAVASERPDLRTG